VDRTPASRNDLEWSAAFFQGALMDDFSNGSHSERAIGSRFAH
jgi:hypothetical protein